MSEEHHALGCKPSPDVAVPFGRLIEQAARSGQGLPRHREQILQPDRDAAQQWRLAVPAYPAGAAPLVGLPGGGEGVLLVDAHPGVDRGRVPLVAVCPVAVADARQARLNELRCRERPVGEQARRLGHSQISRLGHGQHHVPSLPPWRCEPFG